MWEEDFGFAERSFLFIYLFVHSFTYLFLDLFAYFIMGVCRLEEGVRSSRVELQQF